MADAKESLTQLRNVYFRRSYKVVIAILNIFILVTAVLAGGLIYTITHPFQQKYYATNETNAAIPLTPLLEPNLSTMALLRWANTATIAAYTYNFVNYRSALEAASVYFTSEGWQAYLRAIRDANVLKTVLVNNLSVSAVSTGTPVVLQQGEMYGRYSWRVQMPLLITYQSASELTQQRLLVTLLITRISTLESPRGIGIAQFEAISAGSLAAKELGGG